MSYTVDAKLDTLYYKCHAVILQQPTDRFACHKPHAASSMQLCSDVTQ